MAVFFTVTPSDGAAVNEVGADLDGTYFDVVIFERQHLERSNQLGDTRDLHGHRRCVRHRRNGW